MPDPLLTDAEVLALGDNHLMGQRWDDASDNQKKAAFRLVQAQWRGLPWLASENPFGRSELQSALEEALATHVRWMWEQEGSPTPATSIPIVPREIIRQFLNIRPGTFGGGVARTLGPSTPGGGGAADGVVIGASMQLTAANLLELVLRRSLGLGNVSASVDLSSLAGGGGGGSDGVVDGASFTVSGRDATLTLTRTQSLGDVEGTLTLPGNTFTDALLQKLNGIASGAEVNVNADWDASSGDAQILNKPTITTPVQSDWSETDTNELDFIKNKPTIPEVTRSTIYALVKLIAAQGSNVTITPDDTAMTLTFASAGGGGGVGTDSFVNSVSFGLTDNQVTATLGYSDAKSSITGSINLPLPFSQIETGASSTASKSHSGYLYRFDGLSADGSLTVPDPASGEQGKLSYWVQNVDDTYDVEISGAAATRIEGNATYTLEPGNAVVIVSTEEHHYIALKIPSEGGGGGEQLPTPTTSDYGKLARVADAATDYVLGTVSGLAEDLRGLTGTNRISLYSGLTPTLTSASGSDRNDLSLSDLTSFIAGANGVRFLAEGGFNSRSLDPRVFANWLAQVATDNDDGGNFRRIFSGSGAPPSTGDAATDGNIYVRHGANTRIVYIRASGIWVEVANNSGANDSYVDSIALSVTNKSMDLTLGYNDSKTNITGSVVLPIPDDTYVDSVSHTVSGRTVTTTLGYSDSKSDISGSFTIPSSTTAAIGVGSTFPTSPSDGDLFWHTVDEVLYIYREYTQTDTGWERISFFPGEPADSDRVALPWIWYNQPRTRTVNPGELIGKVLVLTDQSVPYTHTLPARGDLDYPGYMFLVNGNNNNLSGSLSVADGTYVGDLIDGSYSRVTDHTFSIPAGAVWMILSGVNPTGSDAIDYLIVDITKGSGGGGSTVTVGTTPPGSPVAGDMFYDTAEGYFDLYDGSSWERINSMPSVTKTVTFNADFTLDEDDSGTRYYKTGRGARTVTLIPTGTLSRPVTFEVHNWGAAGVVTVEAGSSTYLRTYGDGNTAGGDIELERGEGALLFGQLESGSAQWYASRLGAGDGVVTGTQLSVSGSEFRMTLDRSLGLGSLVNHVQLPFYTEAGLAHSPVIAQDSNDFLLVAEEGGTENIELETDVIFGTLASPSGWGFAKTDANHRPTSGHRQGGSIHDQAQSDASIDSGRLYVVTATAAATGEIEIYWRAIIQGQTDEFLTHILFGTDDGDYAEYPLIAETGTSSPWHSGLTGIRKYSMTGAPHTADGFDGFDGADVRYRFNLRKNDGGLVFSDETPSNLVRRVAYKEMFGWEAVNLSESTLPRTWNPVSSIASPELAVDIGTDDEIFSKYQWVHLAYSESPGATAHRHVWYPGFIFSMGGTVPGSGQLSWSIGSHSGNYYLRPIGTSATSMTVHTLDGYNYIGD